MATSLECAVCIYYVYAILKMPSYVLWQ